MQAVVDYVGLFGLEGTGEQEGIEYGDAYTTTFHDDEDEQQQRGVVLV